LKLHFVIPAYNEAANLPCLMESIQQKMAELNLDFQVILVNDGSRDETAVITQVLAKTMPLLVLDQRCNRGPGAAFLRSFRQALPSCRDEDLIVTIWKRITPRTTTEIAGYDFLILSARQI
jgi:dolichol-phosphate mannosyltransferase